MKNLLCLLFLIGLFGFCEAQSQPDLTFVGNTILVSTLPGKIIIDKVSAINVGPANSVECKGNIFVDGALKDAFLIPALNGTSVSGSRQKDYQFTIQSVSGSHTLEVRLDVNEQNKESNELNNNKSVTVTVPKAKFTLRSAGAGKVTFPFGPQNTIITCDSGHTLAEPFEAISTVTLTAVPQTGATFTGWTIVSGTPAGAMCNSTANPCSFKIDKDIFVEGKFTSP
jgi:hypothetical protein